MPFSLLVHEYKRRKSDSKAVLLRQRPYLRLSSGEDDVIFIQEGKFYSQGGKETKNIPDWVDVELKRCSARSLREVGLTPPDEEEDD